MRVIEAETADAAWLAAARELAASGQTQSSRAGPTRELLHCCFVLRNPVERWVVSRRPAMNPAFALAEVVWIVSGRDDAGFLNFWNPRLPQFAGRGPVYYGAYGHRLRYRFGTDQIRMAYEALRHAPDSRQIVLQIWDAASDLPVDAGRPRGSDVPCNVCSLLKLRAGRLDWTQVMRSNDLVLGWPHNVVQFTTLQEMMARWLGVGVGEYRHVSDSLHAYEPLAALAAQAAADVASTDSWSLDYEESMDVIEDLGRRMDLIRSSASSELAIEREGRHTYIGCESATNWLRIVSADAARRAGFGRLATRLAEECGNPVLRQMWAQWDARQQGQSER